MTDPWRTGFLVVYLLVCGRQGRSKRARLEGEVSTSTSPRAPRGGRGRKTPPSGAQPLGAEESGSPSPVPPRRSSRNTRAPAPLDDDQVPQPEAVQKKGRAHKKADERPVPPPVPLPGLEKDEALKEMLRGIGR